MYVCSNLGVSSFRTFAEKEPRFFQNESVNKQDHCVYNIYLVPYIHARTLKLLHETRIITVFYKKVKKYVFNVNYIYKSLRLSKSVFLDIINRYKMSTIVFGIAINNPCKRTRLGNKKKQYMIPWYMYMHTLYADILLLFNKFTSNIHAEL